MTLTGRNAVLASLVFMTDTQKSGDESGHNSVAEILQTQTKRLALSTTAIFPDRILTLPSSGKMMAEKVGKDVLKDIIRGSVERIAVGGVTKTITA